MTSKHEIDAETEMRRLVERYAAMGCVASVRTIEDALEIDAVDKPAATHLRSVGGEGRSPTIRAQSQTGAR